jgi:Flp pilus assembly protein TadG
MIRRFLASTDGAVAVSTAVLLILLIGITGLGAEASLWYQTKRSMQGAADAAAISAAYALTGAGSCVSGSACSWAPGLHGLAVAA